MAIQSSAIDPNAPVHIEQPSSGGVASSIANGISNGCRGIVNGAIATASFFTNPQTQRKVERATGQYGTQIGNTVERKLERALIAPLMPKFTYRETSSEKSFAVNTIRRLGNYHKHVAELSDNVSREVAGTVYALLRSVATAARLTLGPVAGGILQGVALAIGFIVRGAIMATMQLGHFLPYLVALAAVGGIVLLAKANIFAATAVVIGLLFVAQQAQIFNLNGVVDELSDMVRKKEEEVARQPKPQSLLGRLARGIYQNKGKIILGAAVAGLVYLYGGAAMKKASPYMDAAMEKAAPYMKTVSDTASSLFNKVAQKISGLFTRTPTRPMLPACA